MTNKTVTYEYKANQIDEAIVSLGKEAKTLQQKIHNLAVSILRVWQEGSAAKSISDEDALVAANVAADRLNKLQAASPYHSNAFSKWVGMMTDLIWNDDEKVWKAAANASRMMGKPFMQARDNPFWTVSPPSAPKPFIMYLELERIVNKAVKHSGEKAVDGDAFNTEALNKVREAMDILKASGLMPTE